MSETKNLLIVVNSGPDKPYNQYAAYVMAFLAKKVSQVPRVSIYYGPYGVSMTRKGELAKLALDAKLRELVAVQVEGVMASNLPGDLLGLARFVKTYLGVGIFSCGTFHVLEGIGKDLEDVANIEEFVVPLKLPEAAAALLKADKIHYL